MLTNLTEFVESFPQRKGFQGWFVDGDGAAICTQDFLVEEFGAYCLPFADVMFLDPGVLFFAEADGSFDLDRVPDFFACPNTELGVEMLEAARLVGQLETQGDELQDGYMETLGHYWRIDRFCRGEETREVFGNQVALLGAEFNEHRANEKAARARLWGFLMQFRAGDTSEHISEADLSIPQDNNNGEGYGSDEEGEGEGRSYTVN